ncbi:DNA replication and repair protein RecR [Cyclonatronum proteinivorum]|uniref:Recombination protein RecR n=1 Tax=Cyclonatronum proteinivorum TaxID=1457365 RepID=A0A345UH59_9BACT|nr:recombination mediator RecR [Cyclonatronum proteinivorum]AXI99810.1 DNA replication and repair protein RecR [Cyclonatronum proteinivorum]
MQLTSETLERAVEHLSKLPGVGRKSAQRLAMHLVKQDKDQVLQLAQALIDLKQKIRYCSSCFTITDDDPCPICRSAKRQRNVLCVVEESRDVYVIEKTNEFRGSYHVLGGVISPLDDVGPDDIRIKELIARVNSNSEPVSEVILALNPDAEGEATSFYIHKMLSPFGVKVTRIAHGIPMGTELEFIDEATLSKAFIGRNIF